MNKEEELIISNKDSKYLGLIVIEYNWLKDNFNNS